MSKRPRLDSISAHSQTNSTDSQAAEDAPPPGKYTQLDTATQPITDKTITCALPPHEPLTLASYEDYEVHYHKSHINRCLECGRNFPTVHLLSLHIAENHDPLNLVRRDRGQKTYHCFVQDCDKVCVSPQKRRMHLVDKHLFPKNYDFYIVDHGSDNRTSLLRPDSKSHQNKSNPRTGQTIIKQGAIKGSHNSPNTADAMETEATKSSDDHVPAKDVPMNDISDSMAALKFVPKSITFGRGRQRRGFTNDK